MNHSQLLSDPFLQLPGETSVRVVWFTDFAGIQHSVVWGNSLERVAIAVTRKLTRVREDRHSNFGEAVALEGNDLAPQAREIWRHEAEVRGLTPGERLPYRVISQRQDGTEIGSKTFTLAPKPPPGTPVKILLTSDHQLMPMVAANLQKVEETVGRVDAVWMAGDLTNIPDRASEWFDDRRGCAFFPCLQGRANFHLKTAGRTATYRGGELIQHAPLYAAIGNHEVMGRYSSEKGLNEQFKYPLPRAIAAEIYRDRAAQINPHNDPQIEAAWLKANAFNTDTYEEIFSLPQSISGGKRYYAIAFGNVRLVVLYATRIWQRPTLEDGVLSRYRESEAVLDRPENWGYGQHMFEPIAKGSEQYNWLVRELSSPEFQQSQYKVVMLHHPFHTLGFNIVPAYTDPVPVIERTSDGQVTSVRYEYPKDRDYLIRDIEPLLNAAGVQLVYCGHSHLWNRFQNQSGVHFLESSNVGNSYGAYVGEEKRFVPEGFRENYAATGDPNGLEPIAPNIAPLQDEEGRSLPYIASNEIAVFSILDTREGTVSSYRFDMRDPDSEAILCDRFALC